MKSATKIILEKFVNTSLGLLCPCHKASPFFATFTKLVSFFFTSRIFERKPGTTQLKHVSMLHSYSKHLIINLGRLKLSKPPVTIKKSLITPTQGILTEGKGSEQLTSSLR